MTFEAMFNIVSYGHQIHPLRKGKCISMRKIGIICAMDVELDAIRRSMETPVHTEVSHMHFYEGFIHGQSVVAACSGIGKVCAATCAQTLVIHFQVDEILCGGIAGALVSMPHGSMAIADQLVQHDFDLASFGYHHGYLPTLGVKYIPTDVNIRRKMIQAAQTLGVTYQLGMIASGDRFIDSSALKQEILDRFPAIACEMEGGAIAQVCYMNQVPFCVIRCISDSSDESAGDHSEINEKMASDGAAALILEYLREAENHGEKN